MAISRPTQPIKQVAPQKGGQFGKIISAVAPVAGAIAGSAMPGVGTLAGLSAGGAIGGAAGGVANTFIDKPGSAGYQTQAQATRGIPQQDDAISRRLNQNIGGDSLDTLGKGLESIAQAPPEVQKAYVPTMFRAYAQEANKRYS